MSASRSVVWFRRDLRLHDHPALTRALRVGRVVPLFVLDDRILHGRWSSPNRAWFLLGSLRALAAELADRGSGLLVVRGRPDVVVPAVAASCDAEVVLASRDLGPYGRARDDDVRERLAALGIDLRLEPGVLAVEPEDVHSRAGRPYTVFTPFRRTWEAVPRRAVLPAPDRIASPGGIAGLAARIGHGDRAWWLGGDDLDAVRAEAQAHGQAAGEGGAAAEVPEGRPPRHGDPRWPAMEALGFDGPSADPAALPEPGEPAARRRLEQWITGGLAGYATRRDLLAVEGTSRLSADLHFGLLSSTEVLERCSAVGPEARTFVTELAWREFYHHILWHQPRVARESFHAAYDRLEWRDDADGAERWRAGLTGYPVVDAAMRQLAATGWMHNRARMVAASFLTKDLLVDWRVGEAHFMRHLVDGDQASNNGGWQWVASTGTDAQPYFRFFDPVAQGRRFDPGGDYVRRWVPELRDVPLADLHAPWTMPLALQHEVRCVIGRDYPAPIVDHAAARLRALAAFRAAAAR